MAETIHLLGSLGEFVGAIGVVVTLVYLAIQVRHGGALLVGPMGVAIGRRGGISK